MAKYRVRPWAIILIVACCEIQATAQDDDWRKLVESARQAQDLGRFAEAEGLLKRALKQAERFGRSDVRTAEILGDLASVATDRAKFSEAETHAKESLAIREKALGS